MGTLRERLDDFSAIWKKGNIAMFKSSANFSEYERDRVGRIMAHKRRVAVRIAKGFDNPDSALAREVRDILESMPERPRKVGA